MLSPNYGIGLDYNYGSNRKNNIAGSIQVKGIHKRTSLMPINQNGNNNSVPRL